MYVCKQRPTLQYCNSKRDLPDVIADIHLSDVSAKVCVCACVCVCVSVTNLICYASNIYVMYRDMDCVYVCVRVRERERERKRGREREDIRYSNAPAKGRER